MKAAILLLVLGAVCVLSQATAGESADVQDVQELEESFGKSKVEGVGSVVRVKREAKRPASSPPAGERPPKRPRPNPRPSTPPLSPGSSSRSSSPVRTPSSSSSRGRR